MKIAILIPIYNAEAYLRECLDSAVAASRSFVEGYHDPKGKANGVVIMCGIDGATDGSDRVLMEFIDGNADGRVEFKVDRHENIGVSATRNQLLDSIDADVDAVAFLDSDDWMAPTMLLELAQALDREGAEVAECGIQSGADALPPSWINIVNKLYRKETIGGVRFRKGLSFEEDNFFNREVNRVVKKRAQISAALYYYRDNPNSATSELNLEKYFASVTERVRLTLEVFGASGELVKDAYRMVIRKNLKKNRDGSLRRKLFDEAGACLRGMPQLQTEECLKALNPIQRVIFKACLDGNYLLALILTKLT